jgi:hypothetical protein
MGLDRKKRLKKRDAKHARQEGRKREVLNRILNFLGISALFEQLPDPLIGMFLEQVGPGIEVEAAEGSEDDAAIKELRRAIAARVKQPFRTTVDGREFELAFEDLYRAYYPVVDGIDSFIDSFQGESAPRIRQARAVLEQAKRAVDRLERRWIKGVFAEVYLELAEELEQRYSIFGKLIEVHLRRTTKPEGRPCFQIELRRHPAAPYVITCPTGQWRAYPVRRSVLFEGIESVRWNCRKYGIEGPSVELPVFVSVHAILRLHQRLPLHRYTWHLHAILYDSLASPVFFPQDIDEHLVEVRMGGLRVGYFVAKVLPHAIVIKTFLFLTMTGTPEGQALRDKLGMSRGKVEEYKLDNFFTLIGSDIVQDPLLSRIMHECGCGHLLSMIASEHRIEWRAQFGSRLKQEFALRESTGGFRVGQKWVRWSDSTTTVA